NGDNNIFVSCAQHLHRIGEGSGGRTTLHIQGQRAGHHDSIFLAGPLDRLRQRRTSFSYVRANIGCVQNFPLLHVSNTSAQCCVRREDVRESQNGPLTVRRAACEDDTLLCVRDLTKKFTQDISGWRTCQCARKKYSSVLAGRNRRFQCRTVWSARWSSW
ncbi:unnamed protein product, partial [Ectocarpus fasciculatus]